MAIDLGGGLGSVRLTGCAGGVLSEREETVALKSQTGRFRSRWHDEAAT